MPLTFDINSENNRINAINVSELTHLPMVNESAIASPEVEQPESTNRQSFGALVAADVCAKAQWCYERDDWRAIIKVLCSDGTLAMILYRLMQWSRHWRLIPLEMLFNKLNVVFGGAIIGRGAEFGPGFVLVHAQGVVINGQVRGGSHVYIEHQVTIGAEGRESPRLGNKIFIGAGAKIIGAVHVGDRSRVGASAVVVHDVPPGATVVGIPARVVRQN